MKTNNASTLQTLLSASALTALVLTSATASAQTDLYEGFLHPQDTARTKVWWFHGETPATHEGITADLEAFKDKGVGGVVYYDQVHGEGEGASKVFSPEWWDELTFSAVEAHRIGLSFEINSSNGYVAGGKWITPDKSMQRLVCTETIVDGGRTVDIVLPQPDKAPQGWMQDVCVMAVPYDSLSMGTWEIDTLVDCGRTVTVRSITYTATPQGKARTSAMQVPRTHFTLNLHQPAPAEGQFYGCGFRELEPIGELQASDDGVTFHRVCQLRPKYQNLGGVSEQTIAFAPTSARYFRIHTYESADPRQQVTISKATITARAMVDAWQEKASLVSEPISPLPSSPLSTIPERSSPTRSLSPKGEGLIANGNPACIELLPLGGGREGAALEGAVPSSAHLHWDAPAGRWLVMRFVAVSTGGHVKHGRRDALGLECDKLSVDGARLQWQSYVKPVIDSIRAKGAVVEGVCMDSHEAGPQNWTASLPDEFKRLRGYDMKPFLPVMAGHVVGSVEASEQFLRDLRRTISDMVTNNYYGEFARLCHSEGLTLTAQAIGGALCMAGDAIEVKKLVDKPQGEFWGYQTEGNYDIKECSSAAHVYGKQIASGEAFTDVTYKHSLADIKNLADYAYAYGINEFVVCAVAYQASPLPTSPKGEEHEQLRINTANGRQYCLNRMNTLWPMSGPFWDYQARCSWMLRQGEPVIDLGYYIGDDVPCRIFGHQLPELPQGYDFDALGTEALRLCGNRYKLILQPGSTITEDSLRSLGILPDVEAPHSEGLYFCHRRTASEEIYFLNNHRDTEMTDRFVFNVKADSAELWDALTGRRYSLSTEAEGQRTAVQLTLAARQSCFVVLKRESPLPTSPKGEGRGMKNEGVKNEGVKSEKWAGASAGSNELTISGPWSVTFDPAMGGPAEPVIFNELTDWSRNSDERIRYYSGTAIYRNTFQWPYKKLRTPCRLQFVSPPQGGAGGGLLAEVYVNGQLAGTVWCSPWNVDITEQLRKGSNDIEIRVAGTLWNRLVGDAKLPAEQRVTWQTHPLAKPTDKPIPAGIIGDVKIVN